MQSGEFGTGFRLLEIGLITFLHFLFRLVRWVYLLTRDQSLTPTGPEPESLEKIELIPHGHRRHVQMACGGVDVGAVDLDYGHSVDVTESVVRRPGAECRERNGDDRAGDAQHHDRYQRCDECGDPSVHSVDTRSERAAAWIPPLPEPDARCDEAVLFAVSVTIFRAPSAHGLYR